MATALQPIIKYPGAIWRLAPEIIRRFPPHLHYCEPFCGSATIFLRKPPSQHECLNDINSSIVNLFRVLRTRGQELAEAIALTPWSEEEYRAVEDDWTDSDELEHARKFLVRCWQAHGGNINQHAGWKHNGLQGRVWPAMQWKRMPERLLAVVDRLKDAEIMHRPALEVINYFNAPDVLLYCDPPYVLATRPRKYYPDEMTDADHVALLDALDAHQGMVFLSGYAHPLYEDRLAHWQRLEFPSIGERGKQLTEVLWLNPRAAGNRQLALFSESEVS